MEKHYLQVSKSEYNRATKVRLLDVAQLDKNDEISGEPDKDNNLGKVMRA